VYPERLRRTRRRSAYRSSKTYRNGTRFHHPRKATRQECPASRPPGYPSNSGLPGRFLYPEQLPLIAAALFGLVAPYAQPLGPPLPPTTCQNCEPAFVLQKPSGPIGYGEPVTVIALRARWRRNRSRVSRDVGKRRPVGLGVRAAPIGYVFLQIGVTKIRASNGNIVRRRCKSADRDALIRNPSPASQLAAPSSPADTNTEMPSAAAC
jgi:hypothetical protein